MKEFKGTPGPWHLNGFNIISDFTHPICSVSIYGENPSQDAKLIAAAPELLEALQNCQELLTYIIDAIPTGKVRETVTNCNIIALSAINKALGD